MLLKSLLHTIRSETLGSNLMFFVPMGETNNKYVAIIKDDESGNITVGSVLTNTTTGETGTVVGTGASVDNVISPRTEFLLESGSNSIIDTDASVAWLHGSDDIGTVFCYPTQVDPVTGNYYYLHGDTTIQDNYSHGWRLGQPYYNEASFTTPGTSPFMLVTVVHFPTGAATDGTDELQSCGIAMGDTLDNDSDGSPFIGAGINQAFIGSDQAIDAETLEDAGALDTTYVLAVTKESGSGDFYHWRGTASGVTKSAGVAVPAGAQTFNCSQKLAFNWFNLSDYGDGHANVRQYGGYGVKFDTMPQDAFIESLLLWTLYEFTNNPKGSKRIYPPLAEL